jgi:hypothetical protein
MIVDLKFTQDKNAYLKMNKKRAVIKLPSFIDKMFATQIYTVFYSIILQFEKKKFPIKCCYKPGEKFIFVNGKFGEKYRTIKSVKIV